MAAEKRDPTADLAAALKTLFEKGTVEYNLCYFLATLLKEPCLVHPAKTGRTSGFFTANPEAARFIFDLYNQCVDASKALTDVWGNFLTVIWAKCARKVPLRDNMPNFSSFCERTQS